MALDSFAVAGAVPAIDSCLERAATFEPRLRCFAWLDAEHVRRLARATDAAQGARGHLHGVPVGVKDIIDTAGIPTELGTTLFAGRVPERSADVVLALERAGALIFGKTVTAELAYFQPGPTRNPWDLSRTPGGSSMGSAAAVAAGIVPLAVGTQTNGSVIRPAAFCGVVGFKPSFGRISRSGVLTFSPTLDQIGGFARSVEDIARLVDVLAGGESRKITRPQRPPRIAVAPTIDYERAEPAMRERFEADVVLLARAGAVVERAPLPGGLEEALPVLRTIMAFEAAEHIGPLVARGPEIVSEVLRNLLAEGARIAAADYRAAKAERWRLVAEFNEWAAPFDAVLTPPAVGEAPGLETTGDPRFCTRWTLVGAPAITLPTGLGPSGLPLGLQLVGAPGEDARLLATAAWAEAQLPKIGAPPI